MKRIYAVLLLTAFTLVASMGLAQELAPPSDEVEKLAEIFDILLWRYDLNMEKWHRERNKLDDFVHSDNSRVLIDIAEMLLSWTKSVDAEMQLTEAQNFTFTHGLYEHVVDERRATHAFDPIYTDLWYLESSLRLTFEQVYVDILSSQ